MKYLFWWWRRQPLREWKLGGVPPPEPPLESGFGHTAFGQTPFGGGEEEQELPVGRGECSVPLARRLPIPSRIRSSPGAADEHMPAGRPLLPDRGRHWVARPVLAYSLILSFAIPAAVVSDEPLPAGARAISQPRAVISSQAARTDTTGRIPPPDAVAAEAMPFSRGQIADPRRVPIRTIAGIRSGPGAPDGERLPPGSISPSRSGPAKARTPEWVFGRIPPPDGAPPQAPVGTIVIDLPRADQPRLVPLSGGEGTRFLPPAESVPTLQELGRPLVQRRAHPEGIFPYGVPPLPAPPSAGALLVTPTAPKRSDPRWEFGRIPPPDAVAPSALPPAEASVAEPQRRPARQDFALGRIPPPDAEALPPGDLYATEPQRRFHRPAFTLGQIPPPDGAAAQAPPPGRGIISDPRRVPIRTIVGIRSGPGAPDGDRLPPGIVLPSRSGPAKTRTPEWAYGRIPPPDGAPPERPVGTIVIDLPRADQPRLVPLSGSEGSRFLVPPAVEAVPSRPDLARPLAQRRPRPDGLFPRGVPPEIPPPGALEFDAADRRTPRRAASAAYGFDTNTLAVSEGLPPGQRVDGISAPRRGARTPWEVRQGTPPPSQDLPVGESSLAEPQRRPARPEFVAGRIPPPDAAFVEPLPSGAITLPEPQRRPARPEFALGRIPPPDAPLLPPGESSIAEPQRRPPKQDFAGGRIPPPDAIQALPPGQSVLVQPTLRIRPPQAPPVGGLVVDEPIPPGDQVDSRRARTPRATESAYTALLSQATPPEKLPEGSRLEARRVRSPRATESAYTALLSQAAPPEKLPEGSRLEARRVRSPRASEAAYQLVLTFPTPAALPLPIELQASIQPSTAPGPRRAGPAAYWIDNLLAVAPPEFPLPVMFSTFVQFASEIPVVEMMTGETSVEFVTETTRVEFEG